jgi:hypothetical protein
MESILAWTARELRERAFPLDYVTTRGYWHYSPQVLGQEHVGLGLTLAGSVTRRCCWLLAAYLDLSHDNRNAPPLLRRESYVLMTFSVTKCVTNFVRKPNWKRPRCTHRLGRKIILKCMPRLWVNFGLCYCVSNVTKMFTLKGVQTIHRLHAFMCKRFRNTRHTVTFGIPALQRTYPPSK